MYTLRVEHDYFDGGVCRAIGCGVSPEGAELWRRRGLLFRQTGGNEWAVVFDDAGGGVNAGRDTLLLELHITDPGFVLYTEWADFQPTAAYLLALHDAEDGAVEATESIQRIGSKRRIGAGFCTVSLSLTDDLVEAARAGKPKGCRLLFHAPVRRWEYLFFQRDGGRPEPEKLRLEETGGKLTFPAFEAVNEYGLDGVRAVSEEAVPMREHDGFRLRLTSVKGGDSRPKQVLLKHLQAPEPGRYLSPDPQRLRQVCFI